MDSNVKGKKLKEKKYNHAKDNAISALGKIIKYQHQTIDLNSIVPNWISQLPLKTDLDESIIQNDLLTDIII